MTKEEVKEYWDSQSAGIDNAKAMVGGVADFDFVGKWLYERIKQNGWDPFLKMLDIGCGCGRLAVQIQKEYSLNKYTGIDISKNQIMAAKEILNNDPDATLLVGDGENLPFADETFDFVCAFSVFTHIADGIATRLLKEVYRVAKPDAIILLTYHEKEGTTGEGEHLYILWDHSVLVNRISDIGFNSIKLLSPGPHQALLRFKK